MTETVALYEARARLSDLVERVATDGEQVVITRRGRPAARLVPVEDESPIEVARALLAAARAAALPGPESLKALVDEGRRR